VLRKLFLKPDTVGLTPTGGYSGNVNYSKRALIWLVYREMTDEFRIMHGRNGKEYRLPQHPHLSEDDFYAETKRYKDFSIVFVWSHVREVPRR